MDRNVKTKLGPRLGTTGKGQRRRRVEGGRGKGEEGKGERKRTIKA